MFWSFVSLGHGCRMSGQENTGKAEATPTDNFGTKRHNVATAMDTLNLGRGRRTNTHIRHRY